MIAPAEIPPEYRAWNARWHAPYGRRLKVRGPLGRSRLAVRYRGPFACQPNNATRLFEYPWAYHTITRMGHRLDVVEIGGALSGFQFALASDGHRVINIDPGERSDSLGWAVGPETHAHLNAAFGTDVRLIPATVATAGLADASADVVVCLSVLEHLTAEDQDAIAVHVPRILRPGGRIVFTVDLFLDLLPFSDRPRNRWGENVSVREFLERTGLRLEEGQRDELLGFEGFEPRRILGKLSEYLVGKYPALAQCFVASRENVGPARLRQHRVAAADASSML